MTNPAYSWRDSSYAKALSAQVERLFATYYATAKPMRVAAYVNSLRYRGVGVDRLANAVDRLTSESETLPPVSAVIRVALSRVGQGAVDPSEEEKRVHAAAIKEALRDLCDADYYAFEKAFGFLPTRETWRKFDLPVPTGWTFTVPDRAWCDAQRAEAHAAAKAAFYRFAKNARTRAQEAQRRPPPRLVQAPALEPATPSPTELATGLRLEPDLPAFEVYEPELDDLEARFELLAEEYDPGPEPDEIAAELDDVDQDYGDPQ